MPPPPQKTKQDPPAEKAKPATEKDAENPLETLSSAQNVTLDFKGADINNVLKIISFKSGVNIVTTPDVMGDVTIRLVDVSWETALDVILKTYGFGYQRQGNVILVTKLENISKIQAEEQLQTEIITLKFLDAQDARKVLIPLLSARGKISILYAKGQKGWEFGTFKIGKEAFTSGQTKKEETQGTESTGRKETVAIVGGQTATSMQIESESAIKSKTLIITDTPAVLDSIHKFITEIDKKARQVLIETRVMEVSRDRLKDIGFDWGLGGTSDSNNAETSTITSTALSKDSSGTAQESLGGHVLGSQKTPALFITKEGASVFPGTHPYNLGAEFMFKKLTGMRLEAILHALEEDAHTNTLSSPRILTLDNQEASILVGVYRPILKSEVSGGSTTQPSILTQSLDYYQEIGIRLNVVPQINEEGYINMIIHPSITSSSSNVTATSAIQGGLTTTVDYPIVDVREAQTQVLMKDGETVVIGGLLKDIKNKEVIGIPFLGKLPFLGHLFTRDIVNTSKVDLLIFIRAHIVKEGELSEEEVNMLTEQLGKDRVIKKKVIPAVKKK